MEFFDHQSHTYIKSKLSRFKLVVVDKISAASQSLIGYMNIMLQGLKQKKNLVCYGVGLIGWNSRKNTFSRAISPNNADYKFLDGI